MASSLPTADLKALLEAKMKKMIDKNGLEYRGGFLTVDYVQEIFTTENLAEQLKDHPEGRWHSAHVRKQLAVSIRENQKQLYSILLLIGESHRIHRIPQSEAKLINDDHLFGPTTNAYELERLQSMTFFDGIADAFYRKQWIFPPSLSAPKTLEFPAEHFRFPFTSERRTLGNGYHGDVYAVEVPSSFLQTKQSNDISQNTRIAYKKISKHRPEEWDLVQREVDMLQARRHSSITPLLVSFYAGLESPGSADSSTRCLYLLSPLATMDMHAWFTKGYEHETTGKEELRRFIYSDAMLGLASGVTYIHREINGLVGYHRDIKPSNLLLFRGAGGSELWKICDFGSSNLKTLGDTGTTNIVTSTEWAPAEFFTDQYRKDGQTHGRSHDVFSLGCVFLELATILHQGWGSDGIPELRKRRETDDSYDGPLKNVGKAGDYCKSMNAVHRWMEELLSKCNLDKDKKILELIKEMLSPRNERIYAWEVEIDLFILSDSMRSCTEVNKRLKEIIQSSRGYDPQMKHNPFVRAQKKMEAQTDTRKPSLRSEEFLDIISAAEWRRYTPQSTTGSFKLSSIPQKTLSNIPTPSSIDILFGRQDLYKCISDSFVRSDTVALYGLGGVGIFRIAQEYASQFVNPADKVMQRHTFEVEAKNKLALLKSYDAIAHQINMSHDESEFRTKSLDKVTGKTLKAWLENRQNGGWFMVVHGFDSVQYAEELWEMLPVPECEYCQMLITTRTRATVKERLTLEACVQVDVLSQIDSMRLFKHHIQRKLTIRHPQNSENQVDDPDDHQTKSLVEKLWSPFMIRSAAKHMNNKSLVIGYMNKRLDDDSFPTVRTTPQDYLEYILRPLNPDESFKDKPWPRVVRFLFLLAFFHSRGISWDLLLSEYKQEEDELIDMLEILQDCSMVFMDHQQDQPVYVLNAHVRRALLGWMNNGRGLGHTRSDEYGPEAVLKHYNKSLSMICKTYKIKHSNEPKQGKTKPFKPHASKQAFMPHFECFLDFIKKHPQKLNFTRGDLAVRAVILFSKVLLDEDRYDDAMKVTAYANTHFKCDLSEIDAADTGKLKQARISFHLMRQLVQVYLARPQDDCSTESWGKAEELINKLQAEAHRIKELDILWTQFTSPELEIQLEKVRMYWKSGRVEPARRELSHIIESTGVLIKRDGQVLEPIQGNGCLVRFGLPKNLREEDQRRRSIRMLQLKVTREDGLLYTTEGIQQNRKNPRLAHKSWKKARKILKLAQDAASQWFLDDAVLHDEIGEEIAVANTKIGTAGLVNQAITTLEAACDRAKSRYGQCRRTWDLERRLNEARLKSKKHVEEGTDSAHRLLRLYEERLGPEKMATKQCALQLAKGLRYMGRWEDRCALARRYTGIEQELRDDMGMFLRLEFELMALLMWLLSGGRNG